ncbi:M23 family metallopeptidase [Leucobacter weissii]|uniref:M23 family metallopeptidase n=1 Tax=Leucobacter weissii TaxID=1983706 RepID=A0A939MQ53_9MICO|nr:M23 family metallopeptidase [Leucobacter weissii]
MIASASAILCASGLVLTIALPGTGAAGEDDWSAASVQRLSSTGSPIPAGAALEALGAVSAEATGARQTFVNRTDAAVQFPFAGAQPLTDGFGPRSYPVAGFHDAQDFAAPAGTIVQAIADGEVIETGETTDGCGYGVLLSHEIDELEITSRYCHMQTDSNDLAEGDLVSVGDTVGTVGATGIAFGAHLHFVLTVDGEAVDPMPFLSEYNRKTRP